MKLLAYLLAGLLGLAGLLFVVGAQGQVLRIVVGLILLAAALVLVWLARHSPRQSTTPIVQKIEVTGQIHLASLTCRVCHAQLSEKAIAVKAGAAFVGCEYCGASYQLEEDPKW